VVITFGTIRMDATRYVKIWDMVCFCKRVRVCSLVLFLFSHIPRPPFSSLSLSLSHLTHTHTHTYIHTYTHAYTHTHTHTGSGSTVQSRQSYTEDSYWIGKCEPDDDIFYCAGKANSYMYDTFNYYQADNPSCAAGESVSVTCSCENPLFSNAGSDFECDNLNAARDASRRCNNVQGEAYRYVDCGTSTGFLAPICGKVECDTKVTSYNRNQQSNGGYFASTSVPQSSSNPKGSGYAQCLHTSSDLKINDLTCNYCTHTNGGAVDSVGVRNLCFCF